MRQENQKGKQEVLTSNAGSVYNSVTEASNAETKNRLLRQNISLARKWLGQVKGSTLSGSAQSLSGIPVLDRALGTYCFWKTSGTSPTLACFASRSAINVSASGVQRVGAHCDPAMAAGRLKLLYTNHSARAASLVTGMLTPLMFLP